MRSHFIFAVWTSVLIYEPLLYARRVEPVQAWKDHELIIDFVRAIAYRAELILLTEIGSISFGES